MKIKRELKSDVVLKKGEHGWEAWQTNKLLFKSHGFSNKSKEEVMKHIPGYENVIESSNTDCSGINSRQIKSNFPARDERYNTYVSRRILDDILTSIHFIFNKKSPYEMPFVVDEVYGYHENTSYAKCYFKWIPLWIYLSDVFDYNNDNQKNGFLEITFDETESTIEYDECITDFLVGLPIEYFDDLQKSFDEYHDWIKNKSNEIADLLISILPKINKKPSSKQIQSRFNQMDNFKQYTLSECAQYLASLFFDLRTIHFKAIGSEFYTYHELAQELYEKTEDYYDDMIETALGYDSNISAMYILPGDWHFVDENGSFDTNGQVVQTLILERLERIYDVLENVQDYDSMVSSKIDSMLEYFDKEIYKLKQALR